jgi:hypothetical protein
MTLGGLGWHLMGAGRMGLGLNPNQAFPTIVGQVSNSFRFCPVLAKTPVS